MDAGAVLSRYAQANGLHNNTGVQDVSQSVRRSYKLVAVTDLANEQVVAKRINDGLVDLR